MNARQMDEIRKAVRENYAKVAQSGRMEGCGCGSEAPVAVVVSKSCCGSDTETKTEVPVEDISRKIGYSEEDLAGMPEGANMGLGCGNPQQIASLKEGETVLDLGAGGGFDAFLAARQVGEKGKVIGVDMTPDMLSKARMNAEKLGLKNVDFRLGEIEHLPIADNSVDAIISNCVINLSPDKNSVFREAFRVLKPGGRLAVSDVVALKELPEEIKNDIALLSGCVSGAASVKELEKMLTDAGFKDVSVTPKGISKILVADWAPGTGLDSYVDSADIKGVKP